MNNGSLLGQVLGGVFSQAMRRRGMGGGGIGGMGGLGGVAMGSGWAACSAARAALARVCLPAAAESG